MINDSKIELLFKTNPLRGNFCHLYHVNTDDAAFILQLRKSRERYLKTIDNNLKSQISYLKQYRKRFDERKEIYYKMYDPKKNLFCGVTRLTKLDSDKDFGFESGVMDINSSPNIYIDAMFMIYRIGFEILKKDSSGPWQVDKKNKRMLDLHKFVGIGKVSHHENDYVILYAKKSDFQKRIDYFKKKKFGKIDDLL